MVRVTFEADESTELVDVLFTLSDALAEDVDVPMPCAPPCAGGSSWDPELGSVLERFVDDENEEEG